MSHISTLNLEVKDLDSLRVGAEALGLVFNEGQKKSRYFANQYNPCDHAISVPGSKEAYEIGVKQKANGDGYDLLWDSYAGGKGLVNFVGQNASKLKQEYAVAVAEKQARRDGFRVKRMNVDNKIQLRLVR